MTRERELTDTIWRLWDEAINYSPTDRRKPSEVRANYIEEITDIMSRPQTIKGEKLAGEIHYTMLGRPMLGEELLEPKLIDTIEKVAKTGDKIEIIIRKKE